MSSYFPAVLCPRAAGKPMKNTICLRHLPATVLMTRMLCLHATQTTRNQFIQGLRLLLFMMILLVVPCFRVRRGVIQSRQRL